MCLQAANQVTRVVQQVANDLGDRLGPAKAAAPAAAMPRCCGSFPPVPSPPASPCLPPTPAFHPPLAASACPSCTHALAQDSMLGALECLSCGQMLHEAVSSVLSPSSRPSQFSSPTKDPNSHALAPMPAPLYDLQTPVFTPRSVTPLPMPPRLPHQADFHNSCPECGTCADLRSSVLNSPRASLHGGLTPRRTVSTASSNGSVPPGPPLVPYAPFTHTSHIQPMAAFHGR